MHSNMKTISSSVKAYINWNAQGTQQLERAIDILEQRSSNNCNRDTDHIQLVADLQCKALPDNQAKLEVQKKDRKKKEGVKKKIKRSSPH